MSRRRRNKTEEEMVNASQMDESEFPRAFDRSMMTNHAKNRMHEKNIALLQVKQALREGEINVEGGDHMDEVLYRDEYPGQDVIVVFDVTDNNIKTVYYDDSQQGGIKFTGIFDRSIDVLN